MKFLLVGLEDIAMIELDPEIGEFDPPLDDPADLAGSLDRLLRGVCDPETIGRLAVIEVEPNAIIDHENNATIEALFNLRILGELE